MQKRKDCGFELRMLFGCVSWIDMLAYLIHIVTELSERMYREVACTKTTAAPVGGISMWLWARIRHNRLRGCTLTFLCCNWLCILQESTNIFPQPFNFFRSLSSLSTVAPKVSAASCVVYVRSSERRINRDSIFHTCCERYLKNGFTRWPLLASFFHLTFVWCHHNALFPLVRRWSIFGRSRAVSNKLSSRSALDGVLRGICNV